MMETRRQAGREGPSDRAYPDFDSAFETRRRGDEGTREQERASRQPTRPPCPQWDRTGTVASSPATVSDYCGI
jgi:hypothetical protein